MNLKTLALVVAGSIGLALIISAATKALLSPPCELVQIIDIGGCDKQGVCGALILTQTGQIEKRKVSYPVVGIPQCSE
jgi:hypothetical protein